MRRLIVYLTVLLMIFSFNLILAKTEARDSQHASNTEVLTQLKNQTHTRITDPNAVKTKTKESEKLEKALERINRESQKEIRLWMHTGVENRKGLAKAVQKQVVTELSFIRDFALEEGAVRTVEAIDRLLADRNERFEKMVKRMATEEKVRRSDRDDKRDRRARSKPSRRKAR